MYSKYFYEVFVSHIVAPNRIEKFKILLIYFFSPRLFKGYKCLANRTIFLNTKETLQFLLICKDVHISLSCLC